MSMSRVVGEKITSEKIKRLGALYALMGLNPYKILDRYIVIAEFAARVIEVSDFVRKSVDQSMIRFAVVAQVEVF